MNEVAYHTFDGATGTGPIPFPYPRLLQDQEVGQISTQGQYYQQQPDGQQPQQQQQYYPLRLAPEQIPIDRGFPQQHENPYYSDHDQTFYNEILSSLHGFGGGEINGASDVGISDVMASFGFNSILFLVLMIGYEFVSRMAPSVYASRKLHVSDDRKVVDIPSSVVSPNSCIRLPVM